MNNLKCRVLISFLDVFNAPLINALDNLKPQKIIIISEDSASFRRLYDEVKEYALECNPAVIIKSHFIGRTDYAGLRTLIMRYPKEDTVVDLTGGDLFYGLMAYKICKAEGYQIVFADLDKKSILDFSSMSAADVAPEYLPADVKDFISSTGGEIASEHTALFNEGAIRQLLDYIAANYSEWRDFKRATKEVVYFWNEVRIQAGIDIEPVIENLKAFGILEDYQKDDAEWRVFFADSHYKFFCLSGEWLEAIVYHTVKSLNNVDDARGGVHFRWQRHNKWIENEADVLASANGKFIYISCKDTSSYDLFDFNEVKVYSEHFGGEDVSQILVATKRPGTMEEIKDRVGAMGIELVIFDGDVEQLKHDLKRIIL